MLIRRLALLPVLLAAIAPAQSPTPAWVTAAGTHQSFEVYSLRPSGPSTYTFSEPPVSTPAADTAPAITGTLFRANSPIYNYISFAYKITDPAQARQFIQSLPEWKNQFWHVEARAAFPPTKDQLRLMVQSLLAERFHLAIHFQPTIGDVYRIELITPNTLGPQLKRTTTPCTPNPITLGKPPEPLKSNTPAPPHCGAYAISRMGIIHYQINDGTLSDILTSIAGSATGFAGDPWTPRFALDATGLAQIDPNAHYDLTLDFAMGVHPPPPALPGAPPPPPPPPPPDGPSFAEALRKQLGLKLVPAKGPITLIILDHIEKPTTD